MSEYSVQKLTGYSSSKGSQYLKLHIKKYKYLLDTFVGPNIGTFNKISILLDFSWCVIRYGAGINDYFQYNFFKRKSIDRKNFIVARKWIKIIKECNGNVQQELFDEKTRFNSVYGKFLGRDWLDIDECDFEKFQLFINTHPISMLKVKNGSGGNGIQVFDVSKVENLNEEFDKLKSKHVMLEEIIKQHKEMADFNPSSVNTIRIVTIVYKGSVQIMNAIFRAGNGNGCTDNFHHGGLAALIDIKTGIVYTTGVDKKNQKYVVHPLSGKKITGFVIPNWREILDTVKEAAMVTPSVRYVGWDIALDEKGNVCIIEGNCASDPDITQIPDQIGKWSEYKNFLRE